jgi:hypothetical protein
MRDPLPLDDEDEKRDDRKNDQHEYERTDTGHVNLTD